MGNGVEPQESQKGNSSCLFKEVTRYGDHGLKKCLLTFYVGEDRLSLYLCIFQRV